MTESKKMIEPSKKPGEQYPLLKGATEAGDHVVILPAGWSPSPKKSTLLKSSLKFPELFFAFWISLTIFIIGVLLFYVFASVYYDVKWSTIKGNTVHQKTTSDKVSLQYIIGSGTDVPFSTFSELLSDMAVKYPKLKFELQFYLSDAKKDYAQFKRGWRIINQENRNKIVAFVTQYRNVMVEFKTVSKLMSVTPLRYIWEYMSLRYLTFYAGVYEVWKNGGVSLDLEVLAKKSLYGKGLDKRIEIILKRYNDGQEIQYSDVIFDDLKEVAEAEFNLSLFFFDMFQQLVNDTREMFSMDPFIGSFIPNRFKRQVFETTSSNPNDKDNETLITDNVTKNFTYETYLDTSALNAKISTVASTEKSSTKTSVETKEEATKLSVTTEEVVNASAAIEPSKLFLFFTRNIAVPVEIKERTSDKDLYMNRDGSFVGTKSKRNLFLTKILINTGCMRLTPEYAIEKLYREQCGAFDLCDNIHIFSIM